jgi:DNA-binding transcriptional regulator LsrR (DeoR family)
MCGTFVRKVDSRGGTSGFSSAIMYAAARLYYEDELSQQQIADRLRISRTTVSRLLQMARDNHIVRIQVVEPTDVVTLSGELARTLGLRRVVVVEASASRASSTGETAEHLIEPALRELAALQLTRGNIVGVSWGNAVQRIASAPAQINLTGVDLIPVIGGMDETDPRFQTNEIVRLLAEHTKANVNFLHLPARVSPELRMTLLQDRAIAARLAMWDRLDVALVGIGSIKPYEIDAGPTLLRFEREHLPGAVGDIASRYFRLDGDPVIAPEEDSILGITRAQLKKTPSVIAVGAGQAKVEAIVGAARAQMINILVTDSPTATAVIELLRTRRTA